MVGQAEVGAQFEQSGGHAEFQELRVKHALSGGLGPLFQCRGAPLAALNVVRCFRKQTADGILGGTDVAAYIENLRLHIQIGRLHLVDGGRVRLAILPQRLLRFQ